MNKITLPLMLLVIGSFIFSFFEGPEDENHQSKFNKSYAIYSPNQPDTISFAGEIMPLSQNDIKERFDRELLVNTYWQSQTLLFIKKANKYFPIIEPILKEQGIPDDFKYLALAESGLSNVVSPSGASGFWQIMKVTAKENGLRIDDEVDERYHLEKSTLTACKYLNEAYVKFESWTLAAASYNMGMRGIEKQLKKQEVENYYDLLLNDETARYIFRISAIKEILTNPKKYGFHLRKKDLYTSAPLKYVLLDTAVSNFTQYAKNLNINYKILKEYNPWLRKADLKNKDKIAYVIRVPQEGFYVADNTTQFIKNSAQEKKQDTLKIEVTKTSLLKNVAKENEISLEELISLN